jgi:homogentisate 1,2-dioxygenase
MPLYHQTGTFPKKKHIQFEKPNGGFFTNNWTEGFSWSCLSILPCHNTSQRNYQIISVEPKIAIGKKHQIVVAKGWTETEDDF